MIYLCCLKNYNYRSWENVS